MLVEISKIEPETLGKFLAIIYIMYIYITSAFPVCASEILILLQCLPQMLSENNTQHHTMRQCFSVLSLESRFKKHAWAQESVKRSKHVKTVSMNICASTQLFLFRGHQCQYVQQTAYSGPFWLPDRDFVSKVFLRGCFTATTPSNPHEDNVIQMEFNRALLS